MGNGLWKVGGLHARGEFGGCAAARRREVRVIFPELQHRSSRQQTWTHRALCFDDVFASFCAPICVSLGPAVDASPVACHVHILVAHVCMVVHALLKLGSATETRHERIE